MCAALTAVFSGCSVGLGESIGTSCPVCGIVYYSPAELSQCLSSHRTIEEQKETVVQRDKTISEQVEVILEQEATIEEQVEKIKILTDALGSSFSFKTPGFKNKVTEVRPEIYMGRGWSDAWNLINDKGEPYHPRHTGNVQWTDGMPVGLRGYNYWKYYYTLVKENGANDGFCFSGEYEAIADAVDADLKEAEWKNIDFSGVATAAGMKHGCADEDCVIPEDQSDDEWRIKHGA